MAHSFVPFYKDNGSVQLDFVHEGAPMSIVFAAGTTAVADAKRTLQAYFDMSVYEEYSGDNQYLHAIKHLKKKYVFKLNGSIFTPEPRK